MTAEMKWMMNFTANAASQPFHVAVFTFDDVLKDATRIKMEMWIFFSLNVFSLGLQRLCLRVINRLANCPNCG